MKKLVGFVLLVGISFFANAKKHKIELQLEVGQTYYYQSNSTSTIVQSMNGQENTVDLEMETQMLFSVNGETKQGYTMDVQYSDITNTMTTQMGEMSFDSSGEGDDAMSKVFKALTEQKFQIELSYHGEVLSISGIDQMWTNAMAVVSELSESQTEQLLVQLKESFGEKSFKQSLEMGFDAIPEQKVKVGQEWTSEGSITTTITMNTVSVYKLLEVNNGVAVLSVSTSLNSDPDAVYDLNEMEVSYDMGGLLEGKVQIDLSTGWVVQSNQKQSIKGTMKLKPNDYFPEGSDIPMTMEQDITVTGGVR